jgi:hypothetical protein
LKTIPKPFLSFYTFFWLALQLLEQELWMEQAAHFPSFDFLMNRQKAQPAYPNIAPPIKIFAIMIPSSFQL